MKYLTFALLLIGCSGSAPPLYDRSECTDVKLSCYYERGWDIAGAENTRWIGEQYQCNAPITLERNDCIEGSLLANDQTGNGATTMWCCAPSNMYSGMP